MIARPRNLGFDFTVSKLFLIMGVYQANCQVSKNGLRLLLRVRMAELWAYFNFWPLSGRILEFIQSINVFLSLRQNAHHTFLVLFRSYGRILELARGKTKPIIIDRRPPILSPRFFCLPFLHFWRKCSGPEFRGDAKWDSSLWNHAFSVTYVPRFISLREKLVFGSCSAVSEAKMPRREIRGDSKFDFSP